MIKSETPLRTDITLKVPDTTFARISMLNSDESEQSMHLPTGLGKGTVSSSRLHDGLGFLHTDFISGEEQFICNLRSPREKLKFTFILSSGATQVSSEGDNKVFHVAGGDSIILSMPSGVDNVIPPQYRLHNLCLLADKSLLELSLRDNRGRIPPDFIRTLEQDADPFFHKSIITPPTSVVLEQILTCAYKGGLKRLFLEAKCMELIVLRLEQLFGEGPESKKIHLNHTDIQRIHQARDIVVRRSSDPPTLQEIALAVGINSNKLKCGFKQVFGTTVFGFLRNIRLEQARILLQEGDSSVTDVALQVGYNSLSHFARLFKQTYRLSPYAFMKQSR
ncbi:MAG: helix-turn-helix transcriptional regulator [Spirochaetia bacterium]